MNQINSQKGFLGIFVRLVTVIWVLSAMTSIVGLVYISFDPMERISRVDYVLYPSLVVTLVPIIFAIIFGFVLYIINGNEEV